MTPPSSIAGPPVRRVVGTRMPGSAGADGAWHVYGVVKAGAVDVGALALPGGAVRLVTSGNLAAVIEPVSEPSAPAGPECTTDEESELAVLEELARRHEAVLEELLAVTSVLPFRVGTAVRAPVDAARLVEEQAERLQAALARVQSRAEWAVRVWSESGPVTAEAAGGPLPDESPGRAYLLARRQARDELAALRRRRDDVARAIVSDLEPVVAELAPGPVSRHGASGHPSADGTAIAVVLDVVALADRDADERIYDAVCRSLERHGDGRIRARVTGPWPPYHFVGDLDRPSSAGEGLPE